MPSAVTEPLETFIALLKVGETSRPMLYFQLQWEKLKDTITDIIAYIKAPEDCRSAALAISSPTIFKPVLQLLDTPMDKLTEKEHDILGFEAQWPQAKKHPGSGPTTRPIRSRGQISRHRSARTGPDKQRPPRLTADAAAGGQPPGPIATRARKTPTTRARRAQGIGLQTGVDLENNAKEASDAFAKRASSRPRPPRLAEEPRLAIQELPDHTSLQEKELKEAERK